MIIQYRHKDAVEYLKEMRKKLDKLDLSSLPQNTVKEINDIKKEMFSYMEFCNHILAENNSYEAPQDWERQKYYLEDLLTKITNKICFINSQKQSIQQDR
jgi:hypothetical protein